MKKNRIKIVAPNIRKRNDILASLAGLYCTLYTTFLFNFSASPFIYVKTSTKISEIRKKGYDVWIVE